METEGIIDFFTQFFDIMEAIEYVTCIIFPLLICKINFAKLLEKPQKKTSGHKNLSGSYLKLMLGLWTSIIVLLTGIEKIENKVIDSSVFQLISEISEMFFDKATGYFCYVGLLLFFYNKWHKGQLEEDGEGIFEKLLSFLFKNQNNDGHPDKAWILKFKKIMAIFSFDAYEKEQGNDKECFLKDEYVQLRSLYRIISCFGIILLLFLPFLCVFLKYRVKDCLLIITAIASLALYYVELYSYYSGCSKQEYLEENDQDSIVLNQENIDTYDKLYSKEVEINDVDDKKATADKLSKMGRDSDARLRCLGKSLSYEFMEQSCHQDFISAAVHLMNYESIYFATPFYQDIGRYIFPFLNLELLDNKKILVIAGTKDIEGKLRQWFVSGLESRYGHLDFWDIEKIQDNTNAADIGIVSLEQINEVIINNENIGFWENISTVILLEPSNFLMYNPLFISQMIAKFRWYQEKITYLVCDVNINGMVDLLSDLLKVSFVYVNATMNSKKGIHSIVNIDMDIRQGVFTKIHQSFVNELQVAAEIRKTIQNKIHWYGNGMLPIKDVSWEAGQYYQLFAEQTQDNPKMSILYEIFDFQEDGNAALQEEKSINFVEDSLFNAFELFRQFDTRGKKNFHTILFSPNYMLLDYMIANDDKMQKDPQYIAQQMPKFQFSLRNLCIALGYRIVKKNISVREFKELVRYYSFENENILELLKAINECYEHVLGIDEMKIAENGIKEGENPNYTKEYIILSEKGKSNFLTWYHENIETALYDNEVVDYEANYLNALAGGHVYQFYLPNQYFVLEGKYYKIKAIEKQAQKRILKLQRAANSCKNRRYYRQIRQYKLLNVGGNQQLMKRGYVNLQKGEADIEVSTLGYISSYKFNDLNDSNKVDINGIPKRKYRKKIYLKVKVEEGNTYTYAILFKEILFSIFPHCWQLLSVAMPAMTSLEGRIDNLIMLSGESMETGIQSVENRFDNIFYIIEDSPMDVGLLETIYNEFGNFLDIISDYAAWGKDSHKLEQFWGTDFLQRTEVFDLHGIS